MPADRLRPKNRNDGYVRSTHIGALTAVAPADSDSDALSVREPT